MVTAKPRHKALTLAVFTALCATSHANAQQAQEEEATTLATMTVTAQKREEAAQDVPISVTAISEQLLQDTGVRDIKDLQVLVPGMTVTSTQSEAITTARIRGIGTVGDNVGLESSVGVVIDGVYRPRNSVGFGDLGQLERIEVLKGPQGTVFGKNTSAGVINVVTRRPSYTQSAEGEVTVSNYGGLGVSGSYNDALGEVGAFNIYAAKRKRDGWMDVRTGNGPRREKDDYDQDFHTLRGKLLLEPSENLDIMLSADFTSRDENCCTAVQTTVGATAPVITAVSGGGGQAIAAPGDDPFDRVAYSNRPTSQNIEDKGVALEVNWDLTGLGGATLTSITANREWQAINGLDYDFTTADILYRNPDEDESFTGFETFSQEFRLTGATDRLDWMVGAFYSDEDLNRTETYRMGPAYEPYLSSLVGNQVLGALAQQLAPFGLTVNTANPAIFLSQVSGQPYGTNFAGLGALDRYQQNAKSLALFTNNTWHATDALDLTLGLRYTREEKELSSVYSNPNGSVGCAATLANPAARVGGALAARIPGFGALPANVRAQIIGATAPQVAGFMCLPWANALHNGRSTMQESEEKEWSGTLKAAYRWNESVMTYASAARGYKGGGFNLDRVQSSTGLSSGGAGITPVNDTSFPGEFVDSYELGAKTTWADGNLLLNATLFHQKYEDFQLNSFLGTSFVVRSIPEVVSQGLDAEIMWQPKAVRGLMLQGGLMYADTQYGDNIPGADFVAPTGQLYKLPGGQMSFAPKWSGSASVTYEWDFGNLMGRFNFGAKYMSEYNTGSDLDVEKMQDAYTVANARFGIGAQDQKWMLEVWSTNLFDEDYVQVGFDGPLQAVGTPQPNDPLNTYNAFLGAPRMYGVTLRVRY
ncbi:TonB-dependent receptor [Pseudoxanthomonas sp. SL93]|jgi:outer membrane receptor protein involved in Fe transport|uniref:TonB-dependent receptor n=1 Tax=Pseudoxanthomonas sp. SL93 TaxID=2995142 RepID=UPI002270CDC7|nr:TonB-dependent receptor [Pseudoxanthomonas sp. SL93]WAC63485.1 TonB-dependent receptor [Pseudoxanthomonas sp. SL93]